MVLSDDWRELVDGAVDFLVRERVRDGGLSREDVEELVVRAQKECRYYPTVHIDYYTGITTSRNDENYYSVELVETVGAERHTAIVRTTEDNFYTKLKQQLRALSQYRTPDVKIGEHNISVIRADVLQVTCENCGFDRSLDSETWHNVPDEYTGLVTKYLIGAAIRHHKDYQNIYMVSEPIHDYEQSSGD